MMDNRVDHMKASANSNLGVEKTFWEKYAKLIIGGLGAFLLAYCAVQLGNYYYTQKVFKASALYDSMLISIQKSEKAKVLEVAHQLLKEYKQTPYAALASLVLAKLSVEDGEFKSAEEHLRAAIKNREKTPVGQIGTVRLARVLAERKEYEAALNLLSNAAVTPGYTALFEETKGDIYWMQKEKAKAKEAYSAAVKAAPAGISLDRIQIKQADLGAMEGH